MVSSECSEAYDFSVTARPNCSLSTTGRVVFVLVIAVLSLSIALGFTYLGAWPVLPFAGIEIVALGWAFYHVERHSRDYERITICGAQLKIERLSDKKISAVELNRCWTRISFTCNPLGLQCRLALRMHNNEWELGRFMTDEQLRALAAELKPHLGTGF